MAAPEAPTPALAWDDVLPCAVLVILGLALFSTSLGFLPLSGDDHRQLAVVQDLENPLTVFTGPWWGEHPYYRPIHTLLLWCGAKLFGIRWWPHQLFSVVLHLTNAILLFGLLRLRRSGRRLAFLAGALYLTSLQTHVAASWVAARTDLMVGFCLLALLLHVSYRTQRGTRPAPLAIVLLCLGAVLSKESGVVVPLLVILGALWTWRFRGRVPPAAVAAGVVLLLYVGLRLTVFGELAADTRYESRPVLFLGGRDLGELSPWQRVAAHGEVVLKNAAALPLPVFDNQGLLLEPRRSILRAPLWLLTPVLLGLAWRRPLAEAQRAAVGLILLSALVHFSFFAYYLLYLGQIGICLFFGAERWSGRRQLGVEALLALLIASHVVLVGQYLNARLGGERAELAEWSIEGVPESADPGLAKALVDRYSVRPSP